jgi:hypothetical protein
MRKLPCVHLKEKMISFGIGPITHNVNMHCFTK